MRIFNCITACVLVLMTIPAATQTGMTVVPPSRISQAYNNYLDAQEAWLTGSRNLERGLLQRDPKRALEDIRRSEEGANRAYDKLKTYLDLFAQGLFAALRQPTKQLSTRERNQARELIDGEMDRLNQTERALRAQAMKRTQADPAMEIFLQEQNRRELELISSLRMSLYDKQKVLDAVERSEASAPESSAGTRKMLDDIESRQDLAEEAKTLWENYHCSLREMVLENQKKADQQQKPKSDAAKRDESGKSGTGSSKKSPD
jgi:hypothetical protein